jgi:hypothetical protein
MQRVERYMSNARRAALWAALWVLLFVVSVHNHPSLLVDGIATSLMIAASFGAAEILRRIKVTRVAARIGLAAIAIVIGGAVAAVTIALVYNVLVGADARRFGFIANVAMDTAVVAFNVLVVNAVEWLLKRLTKPGA